MKIKFNEKKKLVLKLNIRFENAIGNQIEILLVKRKTNQTNYLNSTKLWNFSYFVFHLIFGF